MVTKNINVIRFALLILLYTFGGKSKEASGLVVVKLESIGLLLDSV